MSLDNDEVPFVNIPGYNDQLSCAQSCENFLGFNGCSTSKCWCSPENFVPGGENSMAACLPSVCSSSQIAAAETLAASIFSDYCTSKGYTDLAQVTAAPSSQSTSISSSPSMLLPTNSRSSSLATTTSSSTFSSTSSSAASSLQAPASHKSGLSSGAAGAIGAVVALLVLGIAGGVYIFLRRRTKRTALSPYQSREEAKPGPHELEPKDIPVKDAQVHKFSPKPIEGPPQGDSNKDDVLRSQELEPKEAQIHVGRGENEGEARNLNPTSAQVHEAFVQPEELGEGPAQAWELDGSPRHSR